MRSELESHGRIHFSNGLNHLRILRFSLCPHRPAWHADVYQSPPARISVQHHQGINLISRVREILYALTADSFTVRASSNVKELGYLAWDRKDVTRHKYAVDMWRSDSFSLALPVCRRERAYGAVVSPADRDQAGHFLRWLCRSWSFAGSYSSEFYSLSVSLSLVLEKWQNILLFGAKRDWTDIALEGVLLAHSAS